MSDTQQVAALYNEIGEKMGTVDILVCEFDQIKILFIACIQKSIQVNRTKIVKI